MGRKKKMEMVEAAASAVEEAVRHQWPVKSANRYKLRDTAQATRPLVPADYETIRERMADRQRRKQEVATEMERLTGLVKATRKGKTKALMIKTAALMTGTIPTSEVGRGRGFPVLVLRTVGV